MPRLPVQVPVRIIRDEKCEDKNADVSVLELVNVMSHNIVEMSFHGDEGDELETVTNKLVVGRATQKGTLTKNIDP